MVDMQAFATTHFHVPEYEVVKAQTDEKVFIYSKDFLCIFLQSLKLTKRLLSFSL